MGAESGNGSAEESKRSVRRARVLLAARLKTSTGEIDARLRDLSQKGALVEADTELAMGDEVVFIRGATSVPARVAWTAKNRIGLEFLEAIDEAEMLVSVSKPKARPSERFRRPRIAGGDLTDQECQLARVWGASVGAEFTRD